MANVSNSIRHRRFAVANDSPINVFIETKTGDKFTLEVLNVSITGFQARISAEEAHDSLFEGLLNEIFPASKITWHEGEYILGRLVLRHIKTSSDEIHLGFSCVDGKIQVDGPISKFLESDTSKKHSAYDMELSSERFDLSTFIRDQDSNVDLFARCKRFSIFYNDWKDHPKFQFRVIRKGSSGSRVQLNKKRSNGKNDFVVMGSYDYLGLSHHPQVLAAMKTAMDKYGFSSTGSPVLTGLTDEHEELSDYLAKQLGKERVLLFSSGYAANLGAISGLSASGDLFVADLLSHASIQDGMQMSQASSRFYKHNDLKHLDKVLTDHRKNHQGAMILTEGVFSMDGDSSPLKGIIALAKKHNARTFIDEAHSFGLIGPNRLGVSEEDSILEDVDVYMSSLSKVIGTGGGFIATSNEVAEWLNFYSRSYMFSGSLSPAVAAASLEALKILQTDSERIDRLNNNISHFVHGVIDIGFKVDRHHRTPIIPLVIGDEEKIGVMNKILMDAGIYAVPVFYPAVSRNRSRFRFSITADHSESDLDFALHVIRQATEAAGVDLSNNSLDFQAVVA